MMHQPVDSDTGLSYEDMLRETVSKIRITSMFFPSVGINIVMNADKAKRLADDLEKIADENQGNS